MSFKVIAQAPPRLNRSQLFVLANRPETFEVAASSAADVVMFEIEDAVPPDQKAQARQNVIEALNDIDWGQSRSRCGSTASTRPTCTAISSTSWKPLRSGWISS